MLLLYNLIGLLSTLQDYDVLPVLKYTQKSFLVYYYSGDIQNKMIRAIHTLLKNKQAQFFC